MKEFTNMRTNQWFCKTNHEFQNKLDDIGSSKNNFMNLIKFTDFKNRIWKKTSSLLQKNNEFNFLYKFGKSSQIFKRIRFHTKKKMAHKKTWIRTIEKTEQRTRKPVWEAASANRRKKKEEEIINYSQKVRRLNWLLQFILNEEVTSWNHVARTFFWKSTEKGIKRKNGPPHRGRGVPFCG